VIQAFVFILLCVAPHPVLGFLTGSCPVDFAGRNHYTALGHGDWQTPRGLLTGAPEQNAAVSIEVKAPPDCTHAVRLPAGMDQWENYLSLQSVARCERAARCDRAARWWEILPTCLRHLCVWRLRVYSIAKICSLSRCVSHVTVLFA